MANALIARGSQPDTLAAIMLPRGARVLASALGILKAGQGFVFLEPTYPLSLIHILRSLTVQEQEETFRRWGHTPFRLLEAPLVDFRLVRLTDGADGLFCKFHHVWCDGWATGLIWSEIFTNYLLPREGKTPHHVHHSPLEFLPAEQAYETGPQYAEDRAFWQAELDGLELSDAVQNPQQRADRSAWRRVFHLPADFSARVKSCLLYTSRCV